MAYMSDEINTEVEASSPAFAESQQSSFYSIHSVDSACIPETPTGPRITPSTDSITDSTLTFPCFEFDSSIPLDSLWSLRTAT